MAIDKSVDQNPLIRTLDLKDDRQSFVEVGRKNGLVYYQTYDYYGNPVGDPFPLNAGKSYGKDFLTAAMTFASAIPAVGPYIAAVNATKAASEGDWGKAIMSALPAAGHFAGQFGAAADTVSTINQANKYAKILKSLEDKDLLSAAFQGADLAGMKGLPGYDLGDIKKAVNVGMALRSGDPLAIMRAGINLTGGVKGGGKGAAEGFADQGTGGDLGYYPGQEVTDEDLLQYLQASTSPDGTVDYSGYGNLSQEQLANMFGGDVDWSGYGNLTPDQLQDFYDTMDNNITITGQRPKEPFLDYETPDQDLTPDEAMALWGTTGSTPSSVTKPTGSTATQSRPEKPAAAGSGVDLSGLFALLGSQQQAPYVLSVPDNRADIELMEDIFGSSLSAPSTGKETDRADELARLLRS
jgi:hypothetical protein